MMNGTAREPSHLWGVVLSGNLEDRRRPRVAAHGMPPRSSHHTPFRQALERATWIIPAERLVAVVARDHSAYYDTGLGALGRIHKVVQPAWRGSAAEMFLPLLKIAATDPDATVAVFPGQHSMDGDAPLISFVSKAVQAVLLRPELPVIIGAVPHGPDPWKSWIDPGAPIEGLETYAVRSVRRFISRPSRAELAALWEGDGLINTHVIVAKTRALIELGSRYLPDVLEAFEPLRAAFGTPEEPLLCEAVYEEMPYASVAHALFVRGRDVAVLPAPHVRMSLEAPVLQAIAC